MAPALLSYPASQDFGPDRLSFLHRISMDLAVTGGEGGIGGGGGKRERERGEEEEEERNLNRERALISCYCVNARAHTRKGKIKKRRITPDIWIKTINSLGIVRHLLIK